MYKIQFKNSIYFAISAISAIALSLYTIIIWDLNLLSSPTDEFLNTNTIIMMLVYLFSWVSWGQTGHRYACVYIIFLLYAFASNAGQFFVRLIDPDGVFSFANVFSGYNNHILCKVIIFQSACIACLHFGALIGSRKSIGKNADEIIINEKYIKEGNYSLLAKLGLFILILFVVIDAISFFRLRQTVSYAEGYGSGGFGSYTNYIFSVLMFYVMFKSRGTRLNTLMLIVGLISVLYIVSGTRSKALPLLGVLLVIARVKYPVYFKKKYILITLPLILVAVAVGSAIAFARTSTIGSVSLLGIVSEKGLFYLIKQGIYEMGMSARPVAFTIQKFEGGNILHEQTILYNLILAIIPRPILQRIGLYAPSIGSLSTFATAGNTSGAGFSFLAEFYFDFGLWAFFPMVIYGFVITKLEAKAGENIHYGRFLFSAVIYTILCKQIFFARGQFDYIYNYLRNTVYLFVLWWMFAGGMGQGKIIWNRGKSSE